MSRATVDLSDLVHQQVRDLATLYGQSVSYTLAGLVARGLQTIPETTKSIQISPLTGLPVLHIGLSGGLAAAQALELAAEDE